MFELTPSLSGSEPADAVAHRVALGLILGSLLGLPVLLMARGDDGLPYMASSALAVGALAFWTAARERRLRATQLVEPQSGLFNAAVFGQRVRAEVLRALRRREPLSLLAIDLACHARVVERGGAAAGERLLRGVVDCIRATCRGTDFVVRRGAEQFLVLAPGADADCASMLARRLRSAVLQLEDATGTGIAPRPIIGAAELVVAPSASAEVLIEAAEEALVIARARGCGVLVLGPGVPGDSQDQGGTTVRDDRKACIRENEIIEVDGTKSVELDVYCPECDRWHGVEGRRRATWADKTLRGFGARPFALDGEARVADVMTRDVICVRPEMGIEALSALFLEKGISGAPVLDAAGRLIGAVGSSDILRNAWDPQVWHDDAGASANVPRGYHVEPLPRATVAEVMTPVVFKLRSDATLTQAAALMAYESVRRVIVVTPDGKVEGLVAAEDVLRWVAHTAGYVVPASKDKASPRDATRAGPILVVDDDDDLRETVADLLREAGYAVVTAANGAEALVALQLSQRPALILLDLAMPVMSGSTLCDELSKDPQLDRIPLVLLSGSDRLAREVGRIDADAFLSKPVEADRLLGTIRRYC